MPFVDYGTTVAYRTQRAVARGRARAPSRRSSASVGLDGLRTPHTGMLTYQADAPRVPAAAIPLEDAAAPRAHGGARPPSRCGCRWKPRCSTTSSRRTWWPSSTGRERPNEYVVVGGHFDSWDVGTGAVDDGGGCIAAWEAVRLMKALGLRPRRTVRAVLFVNEENGLRGGTAYRDRTRPNCPGTS